MAEGVTLLNAFTKASIRFYNDNGLSRAAGLAYTTLFSLVPLVALSLSIFTAFGFDANDFSMALKTIFNQILPPMDDGQSVAFQDQVIQYLENFSTLITGKTLNAVSIAALIISSVALLNSIESALNYVWRVKSNMPIMNKISRNWSVITLGPILIGVSLFITARFKTFASQTVGSEVVGIFSTFIPFIVTSLAMLLLYTTMPATRVKLRDGFRGALIGAALFELVKHLFAYYLTVSSAYSALYGVLASVPLFLLWLYVTWVVVLFGAEIAYQSGLDAADGA